jgi:antitoxin (DNA-binding transcriptional repressor) of toxin-antitoxin stability system
MTFIAVEELSQNFPAYLQRVETGETLVLTQMGKPFAEIKPLAVVPNGLRPFGLAAGEFRVPDDFDDPLPEEELHDFEGA